MLKKSNLRMSTNSKLSHISVTSALPPTWSMCLHSCILFIDPHILLNNVLNETQEIPSFTNRLGSGAIA